MNFDLIQFLTALVGLVKIVCLVVTAILLVVAMVDGDEKRKIKEVVWGLVFLAISVMVFPIAAKIAGSTGNATLKGILTSWDPSYLSQLVS